MIVAPGPGGKNRKLYIHSDIEMVVGEDRLALHPIATVPPTLLGGKNEGKPLEDNIVASNSVVLVSYGKLLVRKGFLRIYSNPELGKTAVVSHPQFVAASPEEQELFLIIRASKATSLDLPWLLKLYLED